MFVSDHFLISAQLVVAIRVRVIYKDKRRGWVRHCGKVTLTHGTIRISPMHYSLPRFSTTNTQALYPPAANKVHFATHRRYSSNIL